MGMESRYFYFNGERLPKWSTSWGLCGYDYEKIEKMNDCNPYFSSLDLFTIHCSIDHEGIVESYDWDIFCGGVRQILIFHLENRKITRRKILNQDHNKHITKRPIEIYNDLTTGLQRMAELALSNQQAFGTTGSENDRQHLLEHMRCSKLPDTHAEYRPMPHKQSRLMDFKSHFAEQTGIINQLLGV